MDIITYALCKKADKEIIDMIHDMEGMTVEIVDEVPTVQEAQYNVMYLVDTNGDGKYEAYIKAKINGIDQIISLGSIIDLSDFYTKSEIDAALAGKQPLLTWDNVPTFGSSNAISSGAIYTALDKIKIEEISDIEYAALVTKDPDKVYFVYEAEEDNKSIVCKDANGNFKYRAFVYGVVTNTSGTGWNKSATDSDAPTTPPTKVNPQLSGTSLIWGLETSEKTVYFNRFSGNAPNGSNASDKDASNIGFMLTGNVNNQYSLTKNGTAWITANFVTLSTGDTIELAITPKPNGFKRIYKGDELYATSEKPNADDITYDNTNSGLTATTTQDAIDELNTNDVGKKEYVDGKPQGEIFNTYSGVLKNEATGTGSHAEGTDTIASGDFSHAEGASSQATGDYGHAEGVNSRATTDGAHAEGGDTQANGRCSHAEGSTTQANGNYSHAEGDTTKVYAQAGHTEGGQTIVGSAVVDPETGNTSYTGSSAKYAHAEGNNSIAARQAAHAEGISTIASGLASHAEGSNTIASGSYAHTEGSHTTASGDYAHAEGESTSATQTNAHAEGDHTQATKRATHAEGTYTQANGISSHAGGFYTIANSKASTVIGKYNDPDSADPTSFGKLFAIGNGTADNARSNILEVSDTYLNVNGDIKQNGVTITSTPHTELTQAQYDALQNPDAGTEYFITDEGTGSYSSLESRLAALEMQETVYYINGVQRVPLYSQNITKVVKVDDNTVDWYFLEPTSQKTYKARVTAQGEGNTRTNPLIIVTEISS